MPVATLVETGAEIGYVNKTALLVYSKSTTGDPQIGTFVPASESRGFCEWNTASLAGLTVDALAFEINLTVLDIAFGPLRLCSFGQGIRVSDSAQTIYDTMQTGSILAEFEPLVVGLLHLDLAGIAISELQSQINSGKPWYNLGLVRVSTMPVKAELKYDRAIGAKLIVTTEALPPPLPSTVQRPSETRFNRPVDLRP